ncbi:MAG: hypothetical protein LBG65_07910 [Puniceicoccales bacterium]|jgi:hypothetical protein|nr:hypothetical protein [Puniceicoccales bacterium]
MKNNTLLYMLIIPALALAAVVAVVSWRALGGGAPALDLERFREDWRSLQGNHYSFKGRVDGQVAYLGGVGRLLSVQNLEGAGRVAVFVPEEVSRNFETGQRFKFKVAVNADVLAVESVEDF